MEAIVAQLAQTRQERAQQIAAAGDLGVLGRRIDTTVSEALVLGLWLQGVRTFFASLATARLRSARSCGFIRMRGWCASVGCAAKSRRRTRPRLCAGCAAKRPRSSPRSVRAHCKRWRPPLSRARTGWASSICSGTRRPKTKARTCSRSPEPNKTPFCGCLAP